MKFTAKARILEALAEGPSTSKALAKKLNLPLGCVPPTMSQLRDAGKIKSCGVELNAKNHVQSIIWRRVE